MCAFVGRNEQSSKPSQAKPSSSENSTHNNKKEEKSPHYNHRLH
jgi:hypothetical protein